MIANLRQYLLYRSITIITSNLGAYIAASWVGGCCDISHRAIATWLSLIVLQFISDFLRSLRVMLDAIAPSCFLLSCQLAQLITTSILLEQLLRASPSLLAASALETAVKRRLIHNSNSSSPISIFVPNRPSSIAMARVILNYWKSAVRWSVYLNSHLYLSAFIEFSISRQGNFRGIWP
jgi:hypothetical protein